MKYDQREELAIRAESNGIDLQGQLVKDAVEEVVKLPPVRRHFEIIPEYQGKIDANYLPRRGTSMSAGYDFRSAVDIVIPSLMSEFMTIALNSKYIQGDVRPNTEGVMSLDSINSIKRWLKDNPKLKPVLVPTGIKVVMPKDEYLSLDSRSSIPLNSFLMVANSRGIIDADYQFADNDGHIHVMLYNMSPFPIQIQKGDKIAQGIFHKYLVTTDDDPISQQRYGGFGSTGR